jgi:DNA-binding transcriptional ArsR family regulator
MHRSRTSRTTSRQRHDRARRSVRGRALIFAALGDETRLDIVSRLSGGAPLPIVRLTEGTPLTRQAVTKHLRVLQQAGLVRGVRRGRENLFQLEPAPLDEAREVLNRISRQLDGALARLKAFLEE